MVRELAITVLQAPSGARGRVAGLAVTGELVVAACGQVLASTNARHFALRGDMAVRDVLATGDALWACGEGGLLAVSRDLGATWHQVAVDTTRGLSSLARAADGAIWVVGDAGFAARVIDERVEPIDLGTGERLGRVYAIGDDVVALGDGGVLRRWRAGEVTAVPTGATRGLTGLAVTRWTWIVVGEGGFIARSSDGTWFSRVHAGATVDLEAIAELGDGSLAIAGDRGHVLISHDDGRTWHRHAHAGAEHLWSVVRFGDGALIGGDGGLLAKLAPRDDAMWSDRLDRFAAGKPLDAVFAAGPDGFLGAGLHAYLDAFGGSGEGVSLEGFEARHGVPVPAELAALAAAMAGRDAGGAFAELRLEPAAEPDLAFCGVFPLGTQDSGDTYHMEIYAWDEAHPRQILRFERATGAFSVIADSLEALVFLAALTRARDADAVSADAFAIGLRKLHGRVAPSWQFAIEDHDRGFRRLEPRRRDTEFFFARAAWITAFLRGAPLDEVRALFRADFNQVVPAEQLPARLEACEAFIPTALYALWRAFVFDEVELPQYLAIGRRHAAAIVRAAAETIDALVAGARTLPRLAELRALELAPDAWRELHDGAAHRVLLQRLDRERPELLAALDELRSLGEHDRAIALPKLAAELPSELEAVLVGSLVRDDRLEGVLRAPVDRPVARALAMSRRALRLAPKDADVQVTHAMLLLDAGDEDELFALLPELAPEVRANVAVRMAEHPRFGEAVDLAVIDHAALDADLFGELGEAVLAHAPARLGRLVPLLPEDIDLLGVLAYKAIRAGQHDHAIALYDRLLALPIPDAGHERGTYLRALNNACVQAHAAQAFDAAVRIANRAQPVAHENPYIYHAAACAYAAVGDYAKAFEQVKLAVEHDYDHLVKVETDRDLGQLLDWPEFKALFRDWHARLEGN